MSFKRQMGGKSKFFMTSSVVIGIILNMFLNQRCLYVTKDVNNSWLNFSWFSGQSSTHNSKKFGVCLLVVDNNDIFTFLVRKSKWPSNSSRMSAEFFTVWLVIWLIFFTFQLYIFMYILRGRSETTLTFFDHLDHLPPFVYTFYLIIVEIFGLPTHLLL